MSVGNYTEQKESKMYAQPLFSTSSVPRHRLGTVRSLDDGRQFIYALAGENLAAGTLIQSPAVVSDHRNVSVAANAAVGDKRVSITIGATAAGADIYKDGFLHVNDGAGKGNMYKIRGHKAISASGTGWIELYDSLREALTTASKVTLVKQPTNGVVTYATGAATCVVGVAPLAVASGEYFWAQLSGPCAVLTNGTIVAGQVVSAGGANGAIHAPAAVTEQVVGRVISVNSTTQYSLVWFDIPAC